jgi:hypothetical protein
MNNVEMNKQAKLSEHMTLGGGDKENRALQGIACEPYILIKRKRLREKTTERRGKRWNLSLIFEMSQHCHKKAAKNLGSYCFFSYFCKQIGMAGSVSSKR